MNVRDLSDYRTCQQYAKKLRNEILKLEQSEQYKLNVELQYQLATKYNYNPKFYVLKLNGSKHYLQSWIECVINASYDLKLNDKINWF